MKETSHVLIEKKTGEIPLLDKVIMKLNVPASGAKAEVIDHVIVQYDRKRGVAEKLANRRFSLAELFGLAKPVEYYRIDTYSNASITFKEMYKITQAEYGEIVLTIRYDVSAIAGAEILLVEELMRRETPAQMLTDKIHEWIKKAITADVIHLFTNFSSFVTSFRRYISTQASGIGLNIEVMTSHENPAPFERSINVVEKDIVTQPNGFNDYIRLGFDAVLIPDDRLQTETLAILNLKDKDEFGKMMKSWMQEYVREYVTYNDISSVLHFKVRTGLIDHWNRKLRQANKGWMVAELALHSANVLPTSFKFEKIWIEAVLKNAKLPLVNTVMLNLEDAERFKNSRVENLEVWIREKLQQTAQNILAKVSYAELISGIDELGAIIKSHLDKMALSIGYRVEYLLTSELVDKKRLNFQFHFTEEEQVFQTTLNDEIRLDINITGRIQSLNHPTWRSTLTPETDFIQEIKKEVLRTVRVLLLRVHADDFYTRFNEVVESKIIAEITTLLVGEFNVSPTVDISPQMGTSPLMKLIKDLQRGEHKIHINCFAGAAAFDITFSVMRVDRDQWSLFSSRSYPSAKEVKESVGERIRIFVENAVRVTIPDVNVVRDARIPELIRKYAEQSNKVVREKLGLIIDVLDVEQTANKLADISMVKGIESAALKIARLTDAINKKEQQILEHLEEDYVDESEIKELEKAKERLQKKLEEENFMVNQLSYTSKEKNIDHFLTGLSEEEQKDIGDDQ